MSKIEKALKAARARHKSTPETAPDTASTQPLVPAPSAGVPASMNLRARTQEIAKMREPKEVSREFYADNKLIYPDMPDTRVANTFRELRTQLVKRVNGKNPVVMVTSAASGHSAGFVAANLAVALSFDETKTALLLNCNLGDNSLNGILPGDQRIGLTDYLQGQSEGVENIIHPVGIQRFRMVPSGTDRYVPGEYFTSVKMRQFMHDVTSRYPDRYVIVSAPSISESADAQILLEMCDYVLMVVPYGQLTPNQVMKAAKSIGEKKLFGVVFSGEPSIPKFTWKNFFEAIFHPFRSTKKKGPFGHHIAVADPK